MHNGRQPLGEHCNIEYAETYTLTGCSDPDHCGVFRRVAARCTGGDGAARASCPGGQYEFSGNRDPTLCAGAPVYQRGGDDGPVMFRYDTTAVYGSVYSRWKVGDSTALESCDSGTYLISAESNQPSGGPPTDLAYSGAEGGAWADHDASPSCCSNCGCGIIIVAGGGR